MELSGDSERSESGTSNAAWWPSDIIENLKSVSLSPREDTLTTEASICNLRHSQHSPKAASQILWSTGSFSGSIPNGFYSIIPVRNRIFYIHIIYFVGLCYFCSLFWFL